MKTLKKVKIIKRCSAANCNKRVSRKHKGVTFCKEHAEFYKKDFEVVFN